MFESIMNKIKKITKKEDQTLKSKDAAKERLHLVLMQDRANVSADFLDLMKQEIIEVIKKYIDIDEKAIDVRLTNKENSDGTNGAPALYANIPILNIKEEARQTVKIESNKIKNNNTITENKYRYEDNNNKIENNDNIENSYESDNSIKSFESENTSKKEYNTFNNNDIETEKENISIIEKEITNNEEIQNEEIKKEEIKTENNLYKKTDNNFQNQNNKNSQKHNKNSKKHKHRK